MAFADFVVTDFGAQWLAQAVEDAQQGTQKAVLTAMRFGRGSTAEPPTMATLWHEDTTSLEVWSGGNSIGIRGIASNLGDTAAHDLDFIEVTGSNDGTSGTICYCKSEEVESIPPASEQQISRTATVSLAVSGDAAVTLATPQTGYAIEESTAKLSPLLNLDDLIVQKSVTSAGKTKTCTVQTQAGHNTGLSVVTVQTAGTPEASPYRSASVGADRLGFAAGQDFASSLADTSWIEKPASPAEALVVHAAGGTSFTGKVDVADVLSAPSAVFASAVSSQDAVFSGTFGGADAKAVAANIPAVVIKEPGEAVPSTFTVWHGGTKSTGVAQASIWTVAGVTAADWSGVIIAIANDGTVTAVPVTAGSTGSWPIGPRIALAYRI